MKKKLAKKGTAAVLVLCMLFTAVTAVFAEEEPGAEAVVNIYADCKAKAAVDGEDKGFTPVTGLKLTLGPHKFEFTYREFAPQRYDVEVTAGVTDLYFQLEPRLEERKNKFNMVDLIILVGVAGAAVAGFAIWGK